MNKKIFRLYPYCKLVTESHGTCLYNFLDGRMWEIEPANVDALRNEVITDETNVFLKMLINMGLGQFYDESVHVEEMNPGIHKNFEMSLPSMIRIEKCFIVLTGKCSRDCYFCSTKMNRMTGCKQHKISDKILQANWSEYLSDLVLLGVKNVAFIGGDPLLEHALLHEIIQQCKLLEIQYLEIFTNPRLLNNENIKFLRENQIRLVLETADCSAEEVAQTLNRLTGIETCVKLLVHPTMVTHEDMIRILEKSDVHYTLDFVFNHSETQSPFFTNVLEDYINNPQRRFLPTKFDDYMQRKDGNTCFKNIIAIMPNLDVVPCPMMDDFVLFNLTEQTLCDGLRKSNYRSLRQLSRDKIDNCNKCEFRFGCHDCRAIEYNHCGRLLSNNFCRRINANG